MRRSQARPKFSGLLAEPIYQPFSRGILAIPSEEERQKQIFEKQIDKLFLLLEHYKIDQHGEHCWVKLAFRLAGDLVPGMRIVDGLRSKRGRKGTWKAGQGEDLMHDVDSLRDRTNVTINDAIERLRKTDPRWKGYTPQNLSARLREARQEVRRRKELMASLTADAPQFGSLADIAADYYARTRTSLNPTGLGGLFGLGQAAAEMSGSKGDGN